MGMEMETGPGKISEIFFPPHDKSHLVHVEISPKKRPPSSHYCRHTHTHTRYTIGAWVGILSLLSLLLLLPLPLTDIRT